MAQIGTFTFEQTSSTVTAGSGGSLALQINLQGQLSGDAGEGLVIGTMTLEYEPNMKSGTWPIVG